MANVTVTTNSSLENRETMRDYLEMLDVSGIPPMTVSYYLNEVVLKSYAAINNYVNDQIVNAYVSDYITPSTWDIETFNLSIRYAGYFSPGYSNVSEIYVLDKFYGNFFSVDGNFNYSGIPIFVDSNSGSKITSLGIATYLTDIAPGFLATSLFDFDLTKSQGFFSGPMYSYTETIDFTEDYRLKVTYELSGGASINPGLTTTASAYAVKVNAVKFEYIMPTGVDEFRLVFPVQMDGAALSLDSQDQLKGADIFQINGYGAAPINTFGGNDTIYTGHGDNEIDGGAGSDTVIFSGSRFQYVWELDGDSLLMTDKTGTDGSDRLISIEYLQFSDGAMAVKDFLPAKVQLVYDSGYAGSGFGIYLNEKGKVVIDVKGLQAGAYGNQPRELKLATGKDFSLKGVLSADLLVFEDGSFGIVSRLATGWREQKFNLSGLGTGLPVKLSATQLLSKELQFGKDIDGNGNIGDTAVLAFETDGYLTDGQALGVYQTSQGFFAIDSSDLIPVSNLTENATFLLKGKKAFTLKLGQQVIGMAEKGSGNLELLFKTGDVFSVQTVDATTGLLIGKPVKLKLDSPEMMNREQFYQLDLNESGTVEITGISPGGWDFI